MLQAREKRKGGLLHLISGRGRRGRGVAGAEEDEINDEEMSEIEMKEKEKAKARALDRESLLGALEDQFQLMLDYEKRRGGVVTRLKPSKRNKLELGGSILGAKRIAQSEYKFPRERLQASKTMYRSVAAGTPLTTVLNDPTNAEHASMEGILELRSFHQYVGGNGGLGGVFGLGGMGGSVSSGVGASHGGTPSGNSGGGGLGGFGDIDGNSDAGAAAGGGGGGSGGGGGAGYGSRPFSRSSTASVMNDASSHSGGRSMSRAVSNSSIMLGPSGKSSTLLPTKQTSWAVGPGSEAAAMYLERLEEERKMAKEAEEQRKAAEEMQSAQRAVDPLKARRRFSIAEALCDSAFAGKSDVGEFGALGGEGRGGRRDRMRRKEKIVTHNTTQSTRSQSSLFTRCEIGGPTLRRSSSPSGLD